MKLKSLLATVCVASVMVGCAGVFNPAEYQYNPKFSYTKNLGDLFGYWGVRDQKLPKGVDYSDSLVLNTIGNEALIHAPQGLGLDHLSSIGLGLLFAVGESLKTEYEGIDGVMGYVPVKYAKTQKEAVVYMRDRTRDAVVSALKKNFPNGKVKVTDFQLDASKIPFVELDTEHSAIHLIQDDIGCHADAGNYDDNQCEIHVSITYSKRYPTPQSIPDWISSKQEQAWYIGAYEGFKEDVSQTLEIKLGRGTKLYNSGLKYKLYPEIAKKLPKYTYIYAASDYDQNKKRMPPMLIEKGKMHLWIKPKQK